MRNQYAKNGNKEELISNTLNFNSRHFDVNDDDDVDDISVPAEITNGIFIARLHLHTRYKYESYISHIICDRILM